MNYEGRFIMQKIERRNATGRKVRQTQPDCHPADAGAGGQ